MTRSWTVFSALFCSVSILPLTGGMASAAPQQTSPASDWHVAPVLATGANTTPYCALALNYPDAGVIITHARNKQGSGTIAFDFRNASFEPKQFYGVTVSFNGDAREFAAEARNEHLLVIDLKNDHPLYAALDAGQSIDVTVQQGGPDVMIAGNSRPFFQLNYCVQALNDAPAGNLVAEAITAPQPAFGLQQPAPVATAPTPTQPLPDLVPSVPVAAATPAPVETPAPAAAPAVAVEQPAAPAPQQQAAAPVEQPKPQSFGGLLWDKPLAEAPAANAPTIAAVAAQSEPPAVPVEPVAVAPLAPPSETPVADAAPVAPAPVAEIQPQPVAETPAPTPVAEVPSAVLTAQSQDAATAAVANEAATPVQNDTSVEQMVASAEAQIEAPAAPAESVAVAQADTTDGDQSRTELKNMLNSARKDTASAATPVREKLSSMSINDTPDPGSVAPLNNASRQSLLYDDPAAVNTYVTPRLSDQETATADPSLPVKNSASKAVKAKTAQKSKAKATVEPKLAETPAPVVAPTPVPAPAPIAAVEAPKPVAKTVMPATTLAQTPEASAPIAASAPAPVMPAPVTAQAPVAPAPIAKPASIAWDSTTAERPRDSLSEPSPIASMAAPAPIAPAKPKVISDTTRTVLADDYAKERETGMVAPPASVALEKRTEQAKALASAAPVAQISIPEKEKTVAAVTKEPVIAETPTESLTTPPQAPMAYKAANIMWDTPVVATAITPPAAPTLNTVVALDNTTPTPVATAPVEISVSAMTTPAPVAPAAPIAPAAPVLEPAAMIAKAEQPIAPPVAPAPVMTASAPIAPAPALPPPIVDETIVAMPEITPAMRPAEDAIKVQFPGEDDDQVVAMADDQPVAAPAAMMAAPVMNNVAPAAAAAIPSAMLQKASFTPTFRPPAAASTGWQIKNASSNDNSTPFCVMQSRFVNQQNLFLSRAADGSATLGIDYGMDLLSTGREYKATVQIDNTFGEDFIAQARQPNLLVIQMGRKDSLFQAASLAKALHIKMDGAASTFDVSGINAKMLEFNNCLQAQGGAPMSDNATTIAAAIPATAPPTSLTPGEISKALQQANIAPANVTPNGTGGYQWGSKLDTIQGQVTEKRFRADKADLLEAVMRDIDAQEKACGSEFASQIGVPEQQGNVETVAAETSCQPKVVAALYQRVDQMFRVWTQTGPQSARDMLVRQRDRLAAILKSNPAMNVAVTGSDEPQS